MKKLIIKIFVIIIVILILGITFNTSTYASTMSDFINQGDEFLSKRDSKEVIDTDALKSTSSTIYNILFSIAVVLAVAVGMIIGIQFMLGSVDEKAKVKETLVPYVIGVFVVFAAFGIWKIVVNIGNDVAPSPQLGVCRVTRNEATGKYTSECLNCGRTWIYDDKIQKTCKDCLMNFKEHVTPIVYTGGQPYCGYCLYSLDDDHIEGGKCGNCGFKLEN